MTETTTPTEQTSTNTPHVSGVDLARVALRQAREAANKRGDSEARAPRRRQHTAVRRDGREPSGFSAVLQGLMADRAWELPATGGTVLDRWPDIAAAISPKLPSHVTAVAYNPAARQLDLRPDSPAYATQLRLITARIIATVNSAVGTDAVRTIRVLPAGAAPAPRMMQPAPEGTAAPEAPVKTRETASAGYRQALAAHQEAAPPSRTDLAIEEAVERQNAAMRELSRLSFPEPDVVSHDAPAAIEQVRAELRRQADVSRAAALRRARAEKAGKLPSDNVAQSLGRTA